MRFVGVRAAAGGPDQFSRERIGEGLFSPAQPKSGQTSAELQRSGQGAPLWRPTLPREAAAMRRFRRSALSSPKQYSSCQWSAGQPKPGNIRPDHGPSFAAARLFHEVALRGGFADQCSTAQFNIDLSSSEQTRSDKIRSSSIRLQPLKGGCGRLDGVGLSAGQRRAVQQKPGHDSPAKTRSEQNHHASVQAVDVAASAGAWRRRADQQSPSHSRANQSRTARSR